MKEKKIRGHLAALTSVCVWGFAFVIIVILLESFTPVEILFFRFGLAALALYVIYPRKMAKTTRKQELCLMAAGLVGITSHFLLQDFALMHTAASNVSVIVAISPVFTIFISWLFLGRERPKAAFFLGAFLAVSGIAFINFAGRQLELHPLGDLLAILCALCWAVYSVLMKKIGTFGLHVIPATRRVFLYGLIFLLPALFVSDFHLGFARFLEPRNLFSILYLGLGSSAVCFVLWNFSLDQLGPVRTSVYIYLIPLVSVAAAVLILGEIVTWLKVGGIVLVLTGLIISGRKSGKSTEMKTSVSNTA